MKRVKVEGCLKCPVCYAQDIKKDGKSLGDTQIFQCRSCGWRFQAEQAKVEINKIL